MFLNDKCLWFTLILLTAILVTLQEDGKRLCNCLPQCDDVKYTTDFEEQIEWQVQKKNRNLKESLRTKQQQLSTVRGFWFTLPRYCGTSVRMFLKYTAYIFQV